MTSGSGFRPNAPDEDKVKDEEGSFGYCPSYETSIAISTDRVCVSSCSYRAACFDAHTATTRTTWHLKDGTYVSVIRSSVGWATSRR